MCIRVLLYLASILAVSCVGSIDKEPLRSMPWQYLPDRQASTRSNVQIAKEQSANSLSNSGDPIEEVPTIPLQELNQCPGTVQRYRFAPVQYKPAAKDLKSRAGRKLYEKLNCASCHAINDIGGTLGPALDGIGGHRGKEWLIARLLDPAGQQRDFPELFAGRPNIMPHPYVSTREAGQIAQYLLTLPERGDGSLLKEHPKIPAQ